MRVLAISRDGHFSVGSEENDLRILTETADTLADITHAGQPTVIGEGQLTANHPAADIVLSMARSEQALAVLVQMEHEGVTVVNSPKAVRRCYRRSLSAIMGEHQFAMPALHPNGACWLKRADDCAQGGDDVLFVESEVLLARACEQMRQRGARHWIVQPHIEGDLVKCYGVKGRMFRFFYPSDDGEGRMSHHQYNGAPHHYPFDRHTLQTEVERLALLTECTAYGADAIITADGGIFIIDFNDWPSFSRCRTEAARAIACAAIELIKQ